MKLIEPCEQYLLSYMDALREYREHNVSTYFFTDADKCDIFEKFENYRTESNLPSNRVGAHFYWLVDEKQERFIGEISIRHCLTDALERYGGHIGYGIRYTCWNQGYGTEMLRLALEKAKELGLSYILITCDDDNVASAKVMEHNGFYLKDKIPNCIDGQSIVTRRYEKNI